MEIKKFRGLNNVTSPERFGARGFLDAAQNVDVDDTGKVLTRLAVSQVGSGNYHSLWADGDVCLVGDSTGNLFRVNVDNSVAFLSRLTTPRRLSYNKQQNTVYFSNGVDKGRVHQGRVLSWGIVPPRRQPVAQPTAGGLPAARGDGLPPGRYQYALTFRRASGLESGTGYAGVIELATPAGIAFSQVEVSADPEVVDRVLYLSGPNGQELYRLAVIPDNSATTFAYTGSGSELSIRLETMFDNPPPAGDIVEVYNGVAYVVSGNVAWHSSPYQFERFCFRDKFLQFPGAVTMFASVNDGIYVSVDGTTWFLSGKGPGDFTSKVVFDYGAIPGTAAKTTMGVLKSEDEAQEGAPSGTAVIWTTPLGVCFGMEGGVAINMTQRSYGFPASPRGAGIVRQARGYSQYIAVLEGTEPAALDAYS